MPELVVASNHLETCKGWQEVISAQTTVKAKDEAGRAALDSLKGQTYFGTRKLILDGDASLFFPDGVDRLEEEICPVMQFGETTAQGWLGRLTYKRIKQEGFIAWTLYRPRVLGPVEDAYVTAEQQSLLEDEPIYRLPIDQSLRRPLHFPVSLINYAIGYEKFQYDSKKVLPYPTPTL
jgi:hypothetical protein